MKRGFWAERQAGLDKLSNGEKIAGTSAILLFVLMFFHWYGVAFSNSHSPLLNYIRIVAPGKSAWEALDYIPIVLVITIVATLAVAALRLTNAVRKPPVPVNAVVAILGIASVLLIFLRIIDPPHFDSFEGLTAEVTVQFPIFLALAAAAGIAFGGCLAMREEGFSLSDLRPRQHRDQGLPDPQGRVR